MTKTSELKTKAMIFAAGRGERMGELTRLQPKPLVSVKGKPILAYVLERVKSVGIQDVVLNLWYRGQQIKDYCQANNNFGLNLAFSEEPELLDTGGGLKFAAHHFSGCDQILIYNADIYCELDLSLLIAEHRRAKNIATLAVQASEANRLLLFNQDKQLIGWRNVSEGRERRVLPAQQVTERSFSGIQVVSPEYLNLITAFPETKFSTITAYLNASEQGLRVASYDLGKLAWFDMGSPEQLEELEHYLTSKTLEKC